MITKSDLNISNLSYCSKDFYQLYPEAKEFIHNLTNVIDLDNTNESDPIVVIVKLACFIADKLNYNIDKNILEAFITSATQEDSFRKLCDMLGYNIKYYNSAETTISVMWTGDELPEGTEIGSSVISLPPFETVFTNEAKDISYVLIGNGITLQNRYEPVNAPVIEGELVTFEINNNNIVLPNNIDDNNRLYLPESMIAENGIWITNVNASKEWGRVENLNTQLKGSPVWKFGYDSSKQTPYIEFPSDYPSLMQDGLNIKYIRTSGNDGNIKAGVLTKLMNDSVYLNTSTISAEDKIVVKNLYATTNGTNIETLDEAYNGFKKTVGTFDTLVTCRDYANAIYQMVMDEKTDNTALVSNCQVSDIRDELNYSTTVVRYSDLGPVYSHVSEQEPKEGKILVGDNWISGKYMADKITDFDLFLYPLKPIKNKYTETTYNQSFRPLNTESNLNYTTILSELDDYKTISHTIKMVEKPKDLYLIKNYYSLSGKIITNNKVNKFEQAQIKSNIYDALYRNFNARMLEYGEEIPYESLVDVIQNSDSRIRAVILDEPEISTFYMTLDEEEKKLEYIAPTPEEDETETSEEVETEDDETSTDEESDEDNEEDVNLPYFKYVAKNVLAGKVPLFNYNTQIQSTFTECNGASNTVYGGENNYLQEEETPSITNSITYISTNYQINCDTISSTPLTLKENESIQLLSSKLVAEVTYPMYVNFNVKLKSGNEIKANEPYLLKSGEALYINYTDTDKGELWIKYHNDGSGYFKTTYKGGQRVGNENFSGIIQANLKLPLNGNPSYAKKNNLPEWPSEWTEIEGLYSLKPSQEISIMKNSSSKIQQDALVYWLANNNNTLTFTSVDAAHRKYECILNDGEYFFYTNKAKTDLLTLGPGTRLTYYATSSEVDQNAPILWRLGDIESITKEDIAENGIGAFAQNDWIYKQWNVNNYLETEQMEIINLAEDDIITEIDLNENSNIIDSNKWYNLNQITYNGETIKTITNVKEWKIRSILNLNMGPGKNQALKAGQSLSLYTSWYADKNGVPSKHLSDSAIIDLLQQDPARLIETIYSTTATGYFSPGGNNTITLKANLNIQKSGGLFISAHTVGINGSTKDNLLIYEANEGVAHYIPSKATIDLNNLISITDLLQKQEQVMLPIYVPDKNYNLISIYYNAQDSQYINVSLVKKGGSTAATGTLKEWKTDTAISASTNLGKGLHIFKIYGVTKDTYLKISPAPKSGGNIRILSTKLVDCKKEMADEKLSAIDTATGINYELLGISSSSCQKFLTSTKITGADAYDFYATVDIDNSMLLDVNNLSDPYSFFDYNNAVNKFVMAELDTSSFKNIEIASSSKL